MNKTTLHVQGMSCAHCVKSVEETVENLAGVKSVKVALDNGTVDVEFDPSETAIETIKTAIEEQGYDVAS